MANMFEKSAFNGDISKWDTRSVTNMGRMFRRSKFDGDIAHWDVSNVTNMESMFEGSRFNQDISNWDVSKVRSMRCLFANAVFWQDIGLWALHPEVDRHGFCNVDTFLPSQSMSDWVIALHLEGWIMPHDAAWTRAFQEVEPLAKTLELSLNEWVEAIRSNYDASQRGAGLPAEDSVRLNVW